MAGHAECGGVCDSHCDVVAREVAAAHAGEQVEGVHTVDFATLWRKSSSKGSGSLESYVLREVLRARESGRTLSVYFACGQYWAIAARQG